MSRSQLIIRFQWFNGKPVKSLCLVKSGCASKLCCVKMKKTAYAV